MTWAAVAGAVIGAGASIYGSSQAAGAQSAATKKGIKAQKTAFNQQLALQEPSRYLGYQALGDLASLYGYGVAPYTDYSAVRNIGTKPRTVLSERMNGSATAHSADKLPAVPPASSTVRQEQPAR